MKKRKTILNHHSASVLPYHLDLEGKLHLILEKKDADYRPHYFNNGFSFIGGNWRKGVDEDRSPEDVVLRELDEEFWQRYEAPESLNEILGEQFLKREPLKCVKYDQESVQRIRPFRDILGQNLVHTSDYIIRVEPPATENRLVYASSIFTRELSEDEFKDIKNILEEFSGTVTTDNLMWGSSIVSVSLCDINKHNSKFAWGYDRVLNDIIGKQIPGQKEGVARTLNYVDAKRIEYPGEAERTESGSPTFKGFQDLGYKYLERD